jgi:hypothetical protein
MVLTLLRVTCRADRERGAQAEGTVVDDLPPGMTLGETLTDIEASIGGEDHYVIPMTDGYRVRRPDESDAATAAGIPSTPIPGAATPGGTPAMTVEGR